MYRFVSPRFMSSCVTSCACVAQRGCLCAVCDETPLPSPFVTRTCMRTCPGGNVKLLKRFAGVFSSESRGWVWFVHVNAVTSSDVVRIHGCFLPPAPTLSVLMPRPISLLLMFWSRLRRCLRFLAPGLVHRSVCVVFLLSVNCDAWPRAILHTSPPVVSCQGGVDIKTLLGKVTGSVFFLLSLV
jgi:hypothetical protein